MHSKYKWLALLVVVALLAVFSVPAFAQDEAPTEQTPSAVAPDAPPPDNDHDGLDQTMELSLGTSDSNADSDGDGLCDGPKTASACAAFSSWPTTELNSAHGAPFDPLAGETNPAKADTDGDGIDDLAEKVTHVACMDPNVKDSDKDPDTDGLTNLQEVNAWDATNKASGFFPTDPCDIDSDADFLDDGDELDKAIYSVVTNPLDPDTDKDGLCDVVETNNGQFWPLNPFAPWTETNAVVGAGEGKLFGVINDCTWQNTNFLGKWGGTGTNPTNVDSDADGSWDGREATGADNAWNDFATPAAGGPAGHISNPLVKDTDGDGVSDYDELRFKGGTGLNMDPSQADTDKDGIPDGVEYNSTCMDPTVKDAGLDSDGDGLGNLREYWGQDANGNGVQDAGEVWTGGKPKGSAPLRLDACATDTDGDGIDDGFEYTFSKEGQASGNPALFLCPGGNAPAMNPLVADAASDPDKDGASNLLEYHGVNFVGGSLDAPLLQTLPAPFGDWTYPCAWDTDGDKFPDGYEYWARFDGKEQCNDAAKEMDPSVFDATGLNYDGDAAPLLNEDEIKGADKKAATGNITSLIPGDPAVVGSAKKSDINAAWDWHFQPSGNWADATNACTKDTDRGGVNDDVEVVTWGGMNANDPADDKTFDHDQDGIPTFIEDTNKNGAFDAGGGTGETNWLNPDTDRDGLCDGVLQSGLPDATFAGLSWDFANAGSAVVNFVYRVNGALYQEEDPFLVQPSVDIDDWFICSGGEDLNADGALAGDYNKNKKWEPAGTDDGVWGTYDDEVWTETNPRDTDTDDDTLCDGNAAKNHYGPTCAGYEDKNVNGVKDADETNPLDADTDGDQLDDALEVNVSCADPLNVDSDGDTLYDGFYVANAIPLQLGTSAAPIFGFATWAGFDGPDSVIGNANDQPGEDVNLSGTQDPNETNPCAADSDMDGVRDDVEYTYYEMPRYTAPWNSVTDLVNDTDIDGVGAGRRPALDEDSDGDNLCDGPATAPGCVAAGLISFIGEDVNADGMLDADETDPMDTDTDGDAVGDESEAYWYETFDCVARTYPTPTWAWPVPPAPGSGNYGILPAGYVHSAQWDCDGDGKRNARDTDSDGDGMPDGFIDTNGDKKWQLGEGEDANWNGLIEGDKNRNRTLDVGEDGKWKETDPLNATGDTDGDGLSDADEVMIHKTNPFDSDTDGDGLSDYFEVVTMACLDPKAKDTDKDTLGDGLEYNTHKTDPCDADTDDDQLDDALELTYRAGKDLIAGTPDDTCQDPLNWDSDLDGLSDGYKVAADQGVKQVGTTADFKAAAAWSFGYTKFANFETMPGEDINLDGKQSAHETAVCNPDSDGDGVLDGIEFVSYELPRFGVANTVGAPLYPASPYASWTSATLLMRDTDIDGDGKRPALDVDSDGDTLCDGPANSAGCLADPLLFRGIGEDVNPHGTVDATETDPMDPDTDGDMVGDGTEAWKYETFNCATWVYPTASYVQNYVLPAGYSQAAQWDCDGDGVRNALDTDSDGDGLVDGFVDADLDGKRDANEPGEDFNMNGYVGGDNGAGPAFPNDRMWEPDEVFTETDPLNKDTDGDGLEDGFEANNGFNPLDPEGDFDGDDLTDADEILGTSLCGIVTDPKDADTDDDKLSDGVECLGKVPAPYSSSGSKQTCDPTKKDTDGDGFDDKEEGSAGVDGYNTGCKEPDTDFGGVSDYNEWLLAQAGYAHNPQNGLDDNSDFDNDGVSDWNEYGKCHLINNPDSDFDMLKDGEEASGSKNVLYGGKPTDPCDSDSDNDSVGDGTEVMFAGTDPNNPDTDGDGLADGLELFMYFTNPTKADSDGDGINDGDEVTKWGTDPNNKDTDGDGMGDLYEVSHPCLDAKVNDAAGDADADGLTNAQEAVLNTDPCNKDTDGDGMADGAEAMYSCLNPLVADAGGDADSDGLTNGEEVAAGSNPCVADTDGDGLDDKADPWPLSPDGDKDGMPDAYEVQHPCLDPKVADADADPDQDGYTNIEEYQKGTDPCVFNCDIAYDWDQDNEVTVNDVLMMVGSWGATPASPNWVAAYDVDGDGVITVIDFMIVVNAIGTTCKLP